MACCIIFRSILVSLLGIQIIAFWGLSALLALHSEFVLLSCCWKNFSGTAQLSAQYSHRDFFFFFVGAMTVIYKASFFFFFRVIHHWKRLLCWGGAEHHIVLPCQGNTQTERDSRDLSVMYNLYKAGKYPTPCLLQTQYENNRVMVFLLGFEASMSALTLFVMPVCCRNARCKGNREMPSLDCAITAGLAVLFADEELCAWKLFPVGELYDHCS